ncbi:hypothetical protein BEWA_009130 [Theileria equi strain WA]|uniref:Uncharacterized protein n=1 Tax=Theileria equi strain WA TaxID=1537102 RepID=L0B2Q4_THEEQ|nr:hypothetical protein BEWA_009130 [Theileria equi strain WA]AFZ81501.1 hypothetical protein BEWA_009130 [Theileria equi strain WA]|eukprot:XP_004831167.1 hypothetical protein BEWA_009130 [Theileria equi strain WA]
MGAYISVNIDLGRHPGTGGRTYEVAKGHRRYQSGTEIINLSTKESQEYPGYIEVHHGVRIHSIAGIYKGIIKFTGFGSFSKCKDVYAYYWKGDYDYRRPLIIKLVKKGSSTYYYTKNGVHWNQNLSEKISNDLLKYLDILNCRQYDVHVVNIFRQEGSYKCCSLCKTKIKAEQQQHESEYTFSRQTVQGSVTRFRDRKKTQTGLPHPLRIHSTYIYFDLEHNKKPLLLYIEPRKVGPSWHTHMGFKWYKRASSDSDGWIQVDKEPTGPHDSVRIKAILSEYLILIKDSESDDYDYEDNPDGDNEDLGDLTSLEDPYGTIQPENKDDELDLGPPLIHKDLFDPVIKPGLDFGRKVIDVLSTPIIAIRIDSRGPSYYSQILDRSVKVSPERHLEGRLNGFMEYQHSLDDKTECFTVSAFKYKFENVIGFPLPIYKVICVSVYYWSALEIPTKEAISRPLLVKITQDSGGKEAMESYYENVGSKPDDNIQWTEWCPSNKCSELQKKLKLLNCRLNNAVIIDISQKESLGYYDACKDTNMDPQHGNDRMQVKKDDESGKFLESYTVYTHSLKNYGGKFHVLSFKNESHEISIGPTTIFSPILDVEEVRVYTCEQEKKPLLVYIKTSTRMNFRKWYQNMNRKWVVVSIKDPPLIPSSHEQILTLLDTLTSTCAPPKVTIDISKKDTTIGYESPELPGERIKIDKTPGSGASDDLPTNYDLYKHTVESRKGSYFTLSGLVYKGVQNKIHVIQETHNVTSVSVYYWSHLPEEGKPLLIKIEKLKQKSCGNDSSNIKTDWYENTGTDYNRNWKKVTEPRDPETAFNTTDTLGKKLDLLNCKLNGVTVIDISKRPFGLDKDTTITYCHKINSYDYNTLDPSHAPLIKVTNVTSSYSPNALGDFVVYKHEINDKYKQNNHLGDKNSFHISGFYKGNSSISKISTPMLNVPSVFVYYCSLKPDIGKPLLIYFEHSISGGDSTKVWYKKVPNKDDWKKVSGGEIPNNDKDTSKTFTILNSYKTLCQIRWWLYIISGALFLGGGGIIGGAGYYVLKKFFGDPLVRLI